MPFVSIDSRDRFALCWLTITSKQLKEPLGYAALGVIR